MFSLPAMDVSYLAALLLFAQSGFLFVLWKSERLREWADVICCGLLGAFVHFLLLQYGKIRAQEWEILSASILVLSFSFMGWSLTRSGEQNFFSPGKTSSQEDLESEPHIERNHDDRLKTLGTLSARFVHEINQPLGVLLLRTQQLKNARTGLSEAAVEKCLLSMESQIQHMLQLSRTLKSFSAAETHEQSGFIDVVSVFEFVKDLCEAGSVPPGVHFTWPVEMPEIEVAGSRTLHAQVLINLIKNAVDAVSMLPSGTRKWIKVEIAERGGSVEFAVANAGPAVHKKVRAQLFKPFFTTKRVGQGLGLGLAISRDLVESVGGEIWYDEKASSPRFVVRYSFLPAVRAQSDEQWKGEPASEYSDVA